MFDIAFSELLIIGVVALLVIGPEKLPKVARTVGHLLGKAQRYVSDVKSEINREMEIEELRKLQAEMQTAARKVESDVQTTLRDTESSLNQSVKSIEDDIAELEKEQPANSGPAKPQASAPTQDPQASSAPAQASNNK
ncbi:Sec-independent protein translocase protein TatB [Limnobacter sp.]|uniref:Sec-independent protein translocase protein TatB n=1 Tax=Limnobacter sp. TaxID=2003368 RepID=UPI00351873DA